MTPHKPMKALANIRVSNVDKKSVTGQSNVELCNYTDVYNASDIVAGMDFMPATATDEQIAQFMLHAGDVLFTKDSETPQDIAVPAYVPQDLPNVVCGYHLAIASPFDGVTNGRFLFWALQSKEVTSQFEVGATGVTRYGLRQSTIRDMAIPAPSLEEQGRIANYLDRECGRLDTLVAEQEHLRQLLIERFTGLIAHTVTKGLAPHVPMKETGVEWIASVPRHWQVMRMKDLGNAIVGLTYSPDDLVTDPDEGTLVLRANNIQKDKFDLSDNVYVRSEIQPQLRHRTGDLLICSRNGSARLIGKCALVPAELAGVTWGVFMTTFRSPRNRYLLWVLRSSLFTQQLGAFATSTINQLTRSTLMDFKVAVPPVDEQDLICEYLENEERTVDALLLALDEMTRLVRERQQAIIAAAVTGKMEVA